MSIKKKTNTKAQPRKRSNQNGTLVVRSQQQRQPTNAPPQLVRQVCGLTDPFCEHARGAKYPDDSSIRTLPYTYESIQTVTTNGTGSAWNLFSPQYGFNEWTFAATAADNEVTAWTNFAVQSLISNVSKYRIVSTGIRLKRITAPLNTSGIVRIRIWPVEALSALGTLNTSSFNATYAVDVPLQDMSDTCIALPHTPQVPTVFYDTTGDVAIVTGAGCKGFCPMTVQVVGAPATQNVLEAHLITHYELLFEDSSGLAQVATPSPPRNPMITDAANYVTSTMKPIVASGAGAFGRYIVDKAKHALVSAVMSRFPGAVPLRAIANID